MVKFYVDKMPIARQRQTKFRNNRPGNKFVTNFIKRDPNVTLKRRSNLESQRATAMSPHNLEKHFARLKQAYKKFNKVSAEQVFNIDESGFSTRTACRARTKALFSSKGRSNSIELKWAGNAQHVTIMPVVSADGKAWTPIVVLPGVRSKYRVRSDGTRETPSSFLPLNAKTVYRDPAGVDSNIFYEWVKLFVEETKSLREKHKHILLTMDGYGAHVTYRSLKLMSDKNIVAIGLPAHTSHRTQVLDYTVFSPFKKKFRNLLNERTLLQKRADRHDIYTLCSILNHAYIYAVRYTNIVHGFQACGVWDERVKGVNHEVITATDITNIDGNADHAAAYRSYKELVTEFSNSRTLLEADGEVLENGTLNTRAGSLLTSKTVLNDLKKQDERRAAGEAEKAARAAEREERREQREAEAVVRAQERADRADRAVEAEERRQAREEEAARREAERNNRAALAEQRRAERDEERARKAEERALKAAERKREAAQKAAEQAKARRERELHAIWLKKRPERQVLLSRSRSARRAMARIRAAVDRGDYPSNNANVAQK